MVVELANDVDQPAFQHAIKKRTRSLSALERMQIRSSRKISQSLIMAVDISGDESDSSSSSGGSLVSLLSSFSGDTDIIIAACLQQRARKMCRIRRITMLKIRARVVTVDGDDDAMVYASNPIGYTYLGSWYRWFHIRKSFRYNR